MRFSMSYRDMWLEDKKSILAIMCNNLSSDLTVGNYSPVGASVRLQIDDIVAYRADIERNMNLWATMTNEETEKWCKKDLKRRGVIE